MTVVPNLLAAGILTVFASLVFIAWATLFVHRKYGGVVMILLSIVMLLVGGGIFPPFLGILIGILGTRINAPSKPGRGHFSVKVRRFLGRLWPWAFSVCVMAYLSLIPGLTLLGYFFGVDDARLTLGVLCLALVALVVSIFSSRAREQIAWTDLERPPAR